MLRSDPRPATRVFRMRSAGGGSPPPLSPSDEAAFARLVSASGKKADSAPPPKFVKKLDAIPVIALPPEKTIHLAVSLAERALIGQFTGLWPSPKSTETWVQNNWRPLISNCFVAENKIKWNPFNT